MFETWLDKVDSGDQPLHVGLGRVRVTLELHDEIIELLCKHRRVAAVYQP